MNWTLDESKKVNLRDLWTLNRKDLPSFIDSKRCIYCIHNKINNKNYIGQTTNFYGRLVGYSWSDWSHLNSYIDHEINGWSLYLYNSISKHKSRNYDVYLLKSDCESLDPYEIDAIAYFQSYGPKGYNLNSGGRGCEQLNNEAAMRARAEKYNGDLMGMCHTPKARAKAYLTNLRNYGDPYGMLHTKEARDKISATCTEWYGDPCGQLHTPEIQALANFNSSLSFVFNYVTARNVEGPIDYLFSISYNNRFRHIHTAYNWKDELYKDPRWTNELENSLGRILKDTWESTYDYIYAYLYIGYLRDYCDSETSRELWKFRSLHKGRFMNSGLHWIKEWIDWFREFPEWDPEFEKLIDQV